MFQTVLHRTPEECAQAQLEAYNARDIASFASVYDDNVQLISLPSGDVFCDGINDLTIRYGKQFAEHPDLHCRLISRIVCDPYVIDEEDVTGLVADQHVHAVATYECRNGKIVRAWFLREEASQ